jgi:dTDP-4-amino-4,6-dideoxygalactose transaminase
MTKYSYNSWPLGKFPEMLQRPEPKIIKEMGYEWEDARDIIDIWEQKVATFAGSRYAVSVDCCSHSIFLCLKYLLAKKVLHPYQYILIPKRTYVSVPMQILQAGLEPVFVDKEWHGVYDLRPTKIYDSGLRWTKGMYIKDSLMCLSFQIKKRIPIGRGGMILTDNKTAYDWLKLARYDGRDMTVPYNDPDHVKSIGWHMYQTPEDCARGIIIMDGTPEVNPDQGGYENYTDLSEIFKTII